MTVAQKKADLIEYLFFTYSIKTDTDKPKTETD